MNFGPATRVDRLFHPRDGATSWDRGLALGWIVFGALLRCVYLIRHEVNSDEPQHLHVAWVWVRGLLPYRDAFDNHAPLFSFAYAPLLAILGPRPDIVVLMRVAMVPLMAVTLWATWIVVRALFDSRSALWAVAIVGLQPDMVARGIEYRSDALWMALWMLCLALVLSGRLTIPKVLGAGLCFGGAFATSMKTLPLAVGFALAAVSTFGLMARLEIPAPWRPRVKHLGAFAVGALLVPGLFIGYFAHQGTMASLWYCVVDHNLVAGLGNWRRVPWLPLLVVPALPLTVWAASWILRAAPSTGIGARRAILFMTAALYWLGIETTWPLVTRQDWLPFVPMAAALATPALFMLLESIASRVAWVGRLAGRGVWRTASVVVIIEIASLWRGESPLVNHARVQQQILGEVLRLAAPADSVMDPRGEAIFRARPYYYALEAVTRARIEAGLLDDRIPERLVSSRTAVVYLDSDDFPPRTRQFMGANYLAVGTWRVLGCILRPAADAGVRVFSTAIPQCYSAFSAAGQARGWLDGSLFDQPRQLEAGTHTYRAAPGEGRVAVIWAPAAERGFSPFH